jgi:hypothetical protein
MTQQLVLWIAKTWLPNRYVIACFVLLCSIRSSINVLPFHFPFFIAQVKAVLFAVEANVAASAMQGTMSKLFFRHLHPLHVPPQNLPFMRMVRLLDLAFFREYKRLIDENVLWLGSRFASTNSDFYQCPERRESYGCIVGNMCSYRYHFRDGRQLFVSRQTLKQGAEKKLSIAKGTLAGLETVVSFKKFDGAKTGAGIGAWMVAEHESKGLLPSYVGYHSTDGASNAVSSINHYELLTEMNNDGVIHHDKVCRFCFYVFPFVHPSISSNVFVFCIIMQCLAHQNNRSAKFAAGTGDFKVCSNSDLRVVLIKAHNIIGRVHRSAHRIKVVRDVQKAKQRLHNVLPIPSVVTRWDSSNLEVASLNRIMGDFNTALILLLDGNDKNLLTGSEGEEIERSVYTFTAQDKSILRQFECGSQPCLLLSKFFQLNEPTCHETLFVTMARIAQMRETSFTMFGDISHSALPDLTKRVRTVVVVSEDHPGGINREGGADEQPMEDCIELFRDLYARDMALWCGIFDSRDESVPKLPHVLAMACLLNPMYGGMFLFLFSFVSSFIIHQPTNIANALLFFHRQVKPTS